jgi:RimJ/RimL family protein N-acetyltransferase
MQQVIIRKATLNDIPTLLQFEQGVINAERTFDSTIKTGQTYYYNLEEMISAPHIELLVAELDGQLIGSGYARIETARHFYQHPQHAYLGFMYTLPEHRGKGVNQKIIAALQTWAHAQNVHEFRLEVYTQNLPAIRAYEKVGFSGILLEMRLGS